MRPVSSARRAFWSLVALSGLGLLTLAGLLVWQGGALLRGVWLACRDATAALTGYLPALGLALPIVLLGAGLLCGIWAASVQLWHTQGLTRALRRRAQPLPAPLAHLAMELDLAGGLILVDDASPYTFTQGFWRPRIWLSTALLDLLDDGELRAVLCHERHHVRQRDPLRVFLGRSLARGMFFLPLAAALRDAYLVGKEVEADVAAQATEPLATALLKLLRAGRTLPAAASLAAVGPMDATRARIDRLLRPNATPSLRKQVGRQVWLSLALAIALLVTSYGSIARAVSPLEGGECGYTTWMTQQPLDATPANYTPVDATR